MNRNTKRIIEIISMGTIAGENRMKLKRARSESIGRHFRRVAVLILTCITSMALLGKLIAHGGVEDEPAPASSPASTVGTKVSITKEQQFALNMLTEVVTTHDLLESVSLTGNVVPRTDAVADVLPPVAGRVTGSALPQLGQHVNRGQVLFRVVQVLTPTERTSLRTEQARAKGDLSAAEREVARLEKLEGVVAGKQLTEARIRRDAARDVYNTISAQLSGQGPSVPVTAPISGEIIKAEIADGEVVDGSRALYQIADLSRVWVEANLFEKDVPRIQGATQAEIRTPSNPDEVFSGILYKVGGTVDPESRTITALFLVDNRNARLKLNMTASIAVATSHRAGVLAVPRGAIVRSGTRAVVFVHTTPEQFEVRDVVTGSLSAGDYVEVTHGLVAGERLLVNNTHQLTSAAGL